MSTNTPAPVIVVTEEKKRRKGLVWVAGGTALLLGGSTFALWSANADFGGGTVTAGDLNLVAIEDTTFWDVSDDRADATAVVTGTDGSQPGHPIEDPGTWRIVPGDKVAAAFSAEATLEGDNLVGQLTLGGFGENSLVNEQMSWTYEVYLGEELLAPEAALPTDGETPLMYLAAPRAGQDAGLPDADGTTVLQMEETTQEISVVVYGAFDAETPDREAVSVTDSLADLTLALTQVRDTGAQFAGGTPAPSEPTAPVDED